ncbi:ABC transporter ATP-binding protein [Shewanella schlegeliana]|uniref:ABC transporter ATP-binding protein n=1 Tax=Shewanella schlegeliana TaxID=190308 RepID=A0ABS1SUA1_9GAMM|nr:ABC transporter ATP-binding protein [Shewanella schlegeliana]MBL4912105.1 ABC transporter ATP-binding protein [Shewanella schlegeliana]MCL1111297.1 ABC transporter ATP-binding protein [Shewanella schlegeliana]GIU32914.1 ABC transporter ATP-binding protein [Shewanella schlegeliana]
MSVLLSVRDLTHRYGEFVAVNNISLDIQPGECYGLLGPNGAGKSTTLEILEGLLKPTQGEVLYRGRAIDKTFKQEVGIQFQSTTLPDYLTVYDCLKLFASFYQSHTPIAHLIKQCQLSEIADKLHYNLSGGQKQRLLLALSLINDPSLLFLDEPTTGLDPQARLHFWQLVREIKQQGKTIILTTHYMEEAEQLCDRIAIMDRGQFIAEGTPADLLSDNFLPQIVELEGIYSQQDFGALPIRLSKCAGRTRVECHSFNELMTAFKKAAPSLNGMSVRKPNLEDLFLKLTGNELRI